MNVGIVGCGLLGRKRASALGGHRLVAVTDVRPERATQLAALHPGCRVEKQWAELVTRPDIDAVVVATSHDALVPVSVVAVGVGKHVLVEKPGARSAEELRQLIHAAGKSGAMVKVDGAIGDILYLRGRCGHGGRRGYETEWRADPAVSGGGELLDQGVHLIDLSRWFVGDVVAVVGHVTTFFWKMPVEDNAFLMLKTGKGQVAWLHVSWTEWKNLFSLEVFGKQGKLQIDGLGGSYGIERLTWYRMRPEMGPPETTVWEFPDEDHSWHAEFADFVASIERGEVREGSLEDARAALDVVASVYKENLS